MAVKIKKIQKRIHMYIPHFYRESCQQTWAQEGRVML